ncbi:MAG: SDR family oxidoreductase [Acholeplasmataceae bacterium]
MKVLMIGGTGIISTEVVKKSLSLGYEVTILNRGTHNDEVPDGVEIIVGHIKHEEEINQLLKGRYFDTIIEFIGFTVDDIKRDVKLFKDKCDQYIFISSASAYQKPVKDYPITEETPLDNPYWEYSKNKADCETYLKTVSDFNWTIVRPSHTYNNKMIMSIVSWWGAEYAHIKRLKEGRPVIIPGDGTSLWTITHASDFANSFVYLFGNKKTYHEIYHITGERVYTWERLTEIMANALGVKANVVHIPTDEIVKDFPELEGPLLGDKTWSAIFDNSKIKGISKAYTSHIGYEDVVDQVIAYYEEHKEIQHIDDHFEERYDQLINKYRNL